MEQFRKQRENVIAQITVEVNQLTIRLEKVWEKCERLYGYFTILIVDETGIYREQ